MKTHEQIDRRSLLLAKAVAGKIDADPKRKGLDLARSVCERWLARQSGGPAVREWREILKRPWSQVRRVLLDESEEGQRLRQSTPFCGILTPKERWDIYRTFRDEESAKGRL
jgi:hypothetical protein